MNTASYVRAPLASAPYPFPTTPMRAVSVRQPWAWLLASGWKDIENRAWHPSFEHGPIWLAVHAGKRVEDGLQTFFECDLGTEIPIVTSAIVGAMLVDAHVTGTDGSSSPWYAGESGWTVKASVLFSEPIVGVAGALGCFRLPLAVYVALEERWNAGEHRTWRTE